MSVQAVAVTPVNGADATAAFALVRRVVESWKVGDADTFASVFAPDATVVLSGHIYNGRDEIRTGMAVAFAGEWAGTHVYGAPVVVRQLGDDAILLVSEGGPYRPGATEVPVETAIRAMWFFAKTDGEWLVTAYANTPARTAVALPGAD